MQVHLVAHRLEMLEEVLPTCLIEARRVLSAHQNQLSSSQTGRRKGNRLLHLQAPGAVDWPAGRAGEGARSCTAGMGRRLGATSSQKWKESFKLDGRAPKTCFWIEYFKRKISR
jgi:hypothetical protein